MPGVSVESHLERIWNNAIHRSFIEGLDSVQSKALLELLLIAAGADDSVTHDEQAEIRRALAELPAFQPAAVDLADGTAAENVDRFVADYAADPDATLDAIVEALGDDAARRHAFRTTVQFLEADGFAPGEEIFVRTLGRRFQIEAEVVEFAVANARSIH